MNSRGCKSKMNKTIGVLTLSFAMVLSLLSPSSMAAAKSPKLSKSKMNVSVGKTVTLKLKNVSRKAKVKWTSKAKNIAKVVKSTKKSAKIKGVKAGKATIKVTYKLGKKSKTLSCKVVVKGKSTVKVTPSPSPIPSISETATPNTSVPSNIPDISSSPNVPEPAYKWVTTWGTAEEKCDATDSAMPKMALTNTTVRQIIRVTTGGNKLRLRLSNQYGKSDVEIQSLHFAKQIKADASTIDVSTDTAVTVNGEEEFIIPKGKVILTDEIEFPVDALENIAVSIYFGAAPVDNITGHRGARATTYQVSGNQVSEEKFSSAKTTTSWFFLADVSMWSPEDSRAVVCFGDSITDGYGTDATYLGKKPDSYTRWIDYFAKRLQENEGTKHVSLINEGIGANSILGSYPTDAGKDRFARDLLEHDGVEYCIILFGVNDITNLKETSKYNLLIPEYKKMIQLCHDHGIKVYGAPILPFGTSDSYTEPSEQVRTMINDWMRSEDSGVDGIIDFESAVADPANPKNILEKYAHEDGLHPYDGYSAMADAIDLSMFE
ncbi:MAG: hypothetical protein HFG34_11395 [Eubacterium sp.]|nr:hypothetical protein [Eubacterium sp.]